MAASLYKKIILQNLTEIIELDFFVFVSHFISNKTLTFEDFDRLENYTDTNYPSSERKAFKMIKIAQLLHELNSHEVIEVAIKATRHCGNEELAAKMESELNVGSVQPPNSEVEAEDSSQSSSSQDVNSCVSAVSSYSNHCSPEDSDTPMTN